MTRRFVVLIALACTGCMLHEPEGPFVPPPVVERAALPSPPLERVEVVRLPSPGDRLPAWEAPVVTKKEGSPRSSQAVVAQAALHARVLPSAATTRGGEHVYPWSPGQVYTVLLTKTQATGIFLPPGEQVASGFYLDQDAFEVKTQRAGTGDSAYDALIVRPLQDSGSVETFLLTQAGTRYFFHFVVGKTGMLAVTFTGQ